MRGAFCSPKVKSSKTSHSFPPKNALRQRIWALYIAGSQVCRGNNSAPDSNFQDLDRYKLFIHEKALREMQTLRTGCSKVEPKKFAPPQTPFPGTQDGQNFNQLEMVTTFTYRPSLVKIDACNFGLSW